jgi:hypothetical protein
MRFLFSALIPIFLGVISYACIIKYNYYTQENMVQKNGRIGIGTIIDRSDCEKMHSRARNKTVLLLVSVRGMIFKLKHNYIHCRDLNLNGKIEIMFEPGATYAFLVGQHRDIDEYLNPIIFVAALLGWFWYFRRVINHKSPIVFGVLLVCTMTSSSLHQLPRMFQTAPADLPTAVRSKIRGPLPNSWA